MDISAQVPQLPDKSPLHKLRKAQRIIEMTKKGVLAGPFKTCDAQVLSPLKMVDKSVKNDAKRMTYDGSQSMMAKKLGIEGGKAGINR